MIEGTVHVPRPAGGWGEPWPRLFELASSLPQRSWMLIGGLMTQAHGMAAGIEVVRPTLDVDLIVLVYLDPDPFGQTVAQLEQLGYEFQAPVSRGGPAHRFVRGRHEVDIGLADRLGPNRAHTLRRRKVLEIDGGQQATKRMSHLEVEGCEAPMLIPDRLGALVLKGAAFLVDSRDRDRHLQDAAVLAATITDHAHQLTRLKGSDGKRLRALSEALSPVRHSAWLRLDEQQRQAGRDTLRILTSTSGSAKSEILPAYLRHAGD